MGFFGKLFNFVRGRGWQETEEINKAKELADKLDSAKDAASQIQQETAIEQEQERIKEVAELPETRETQTVLSGPDKEAEEAVKQIRRAPEAKQFTDKIDPNIVNEFEIEGKLETINDLRPYYNNALSANGKLDDPDVLKILIENREKLRHRFHTVFKVYATDGTLAGELNITGLLLEDASGIRNFVEEGQHISGTEGLSLKFDEAISYFQSKGALSSNKNILKGGVTYNVGKVTTSVSFA